MEKKKFFYENDFLIIFVLGFYLSVIFSFVINNIQAESYKLFLNYLSVQIFYISTVFVFSRIRKISVVQAIPLKVKINIKKYIAAIFCAVGLFMFALLPNISITYLFTKLGLNPTVQVPVMKGFLNIFLGTGIICIMPAIGEELVFRGVLRSSFRNYGGTTIIILSGIIFSLSHLNIAQTVYQFFIGMLLCYIFMKTNNILFSMIIHCINNMLALFLPAGIPFFANIGIDGKSLLILIPFFFVGIIIFLFSLKKLVNNEKESFFAVLKKTFVSIGSVFVPKKVKNNFERYNKEFEKTKKVHIYIKIMIFVLILLLVLTILV